MFGTVSSAACMQQDVTIKSNRQDVSIKSNRQDVSIKSNRQDVCTCIPRQPTCMKLGTGGFYQPIQSYMCKQGSYM